MTAGEKRKWIREFNRLAQAADMAWTIYAKSLGSAHEEIAHFESKVIQMHRRAPGWGHLGLVGRGLRVQKIFGPGEYKVVIDNMPSFIIHGQLIRGTSIDTARAEYAVILAEMIAE